MRLPGSTRTATMPGRKILTRTGAGTTCRITEMFGCRMSLRDGLRIAMATGLMSLTTAGLGLAMSPGAGLLITMGAGSGMAVRGPGGRGRSADFIVRSGRRLMCHFLDGGADLVLALDGAA